ncbi:MAG TPA: hypothetical protein VJ770_01780 [Stellaceae bacterium]|nr:hypothetical protein [Stellaceae bacterium]
MSAGEAVLSLAWPIDLTLTAASHGWVELAPWRWDPERAVLSRSERIGNRLGEIAVGQSGPAAMAVRWNGFGPDEGPEILRRVGRWLSADWEPAAAIAALRPVLPLAALLVVRGGGRMLRCSTFYEDFAKTLLTVNTSWSGTCRMAAALVFEPGGGAFPPPGLILDYGETRLRERTRLGFRAATLLAATRRMLADCVIDPSGEGRPDHDYLIALKGIGPYAAAHCRILLQDFTRLPVDSTVVAYLRERQGCDAAEFAARYASCGPYLALGYRLMRLADRLGPRKAWP